MPSLAENDGKKLNVTERKKKETEESNKNDKSEKLLNVSK